MGFGLVAGGRFLIGRWVRGMNEPDPATVPPERVARLARAAGIEAEVERVLYLNKDVNAAVFVGRGVSLDPSMIAKGQYREGSGRWGTVAVRALGGGRSRVAFCAATTAGEWAQARAWFPGVVARLGE